MPTYVRWREDGATYFFTVVTCKRQPILTAPVSRQLLRIAIDSVRKRLPFDILTMVLLPEHLHCIWTLPPDDNDFPRRWQQIKGRFAHDYLAQGGRQQRLTHQQESQRRLGVWQPRYWEHRIRDEEDFSRYRDYIHLNPVKHGHVENPGDWSWTSFHRHVASGWLDPDWPGASPVDLPDVQE